MPRRILALMAAAAALPALGWLGLAAVTVVRYRSGVGEMPGLEEVVVSTTWSFLVMGAIALGALAVVSSSALGGLLVVGAATAGVLGLAAFIGRDGRG